MASNSRKGGRTGRKVGFSIGDSRGLEGRSEIADLREFYPDISLEI
jgi:hypothetical protein